MTVFSCIIFYPSIAYNLILCQLGCRRWYNRIDETVLLGALPFRFYNRELIHHNVRGVLTMTQSFEHRHWVNTRKEWRILGIEQMILSTPDLGPPPPDTIIRKGVEFIKKFQRRGDSVYVHCKAGRTRSAIIVACYISEIMNLNAEEAVEYVRKRRPVIKLDEDHMDAIRRYYSKYVNRKAKESFIEYFFKRNFLKTKFGSSIDKDKNARIILDKDKSFKTTANTNEIAIEYDIGKNNKSAPDLKSPTKQLPPSKEESKSNSKIL